MTSNGAEASGTVGGQDGALVGQGMCIIQSVYDHFGCV